jgi:hypothetical protein
MVDSGLLRRYRGLAISANNVIFSGRNAVVVLHGLTKESRVPPAEIERAIVRMRSYLADPSAHTHRE